MKISLNNMTGHVHTT